MSLPRPSGAGRLVRIGLRGAGFVGATLLVVLLGLRHLSDVGSSLDRLAQARLQGAATAAARTLDDDFARFAHLAGGVAPGDLRGDRLALTARLLRMQIALPGTSEVFAATAAGRLVAASDPLPANAPDLTQQPWFLAALQPDGQGLSIARAPADWMRAAPSLVLTMPVRDAGGTVIGMVGAAVPPSEVRRLLERAPLPAGASLRLMGPADSLLAAAGVAPGGAGAEGAGVEGAGPGADTTADPARLIARIALRGTPPTLSVAAALALAPARIVATLPQAVAWSSGWPVLRGEVAGFGLELLGLWAVLGLLLLPRGWLGRARTVTGDVPVLPATLDPPDAEAIVPAVRQQPAPLPEPSDPLPAPDLAPISERAAAERAANDRVAAAESRAAAAEAALSAAGTEIETLRREQELALAAIGHDMRTPMQGVLGICDLLLDGALEDEQRHWVEHLRASGTALLALLNGLLAIAGRSAAPAVATDLVGLLEDATTLFAAEAAGKDIVLATRLDPALHGTWQVDAARLRQIVVNLLANAVGRTRAGRVELRAAPEIGPLGRPLLRIAVADTGPGIAAGDAERIFEVFQRADTASRGPGLGLALCRQNAEAMGGTVTVDSRPGEGATFTLVCPADPEVPATRPEAFAGRAALLVGVSEPAQTALRAQFEQIGFSVEAAADGFVGLALAERAVALHGALDLVVVDLGVAGMAADSFCVRLRSTAFGRSLVLVGLADRLDEPRPAGVDALLPRTAAPAEIAAAATGLLAGHPALTALLPAGAGGTGGRVLIVEDDETNRVLLAAALARSGFTAFPAATGEEAVRMAEHDGLDAVLLDLRLPGIDGWETARRIRALPGRSASIPIVALTARGDAGLEAECRIAGLTALVSKPADLNQLAQRLRGWIAAGPRPAAATPAPDLGAPISPVVQVSGPFLEAMVSEIGLERTRACVQEFLDEASTKCVRLAELIPGWEAGAVVRLCDDLKGLADLFGAVGFSETLEDLAAAIETGARDAAAEAMARLEAGLPMLPDAIWTCLAGIERRRAERGRRAA
ncbi:MAG: response regulator [Proteobacteria bacterium]|nr:response regulator [Pseudomonadota bacterium]